MFTVGGAPAFEDLVLALDFNLETNLIDRSALAEQFSDPWRQIGPCDCEIVHPFDALHKAVRLIV